MHLIGITGGVGAGKTFVLNTLKENCSCRILPADDVGNLVKLPGGACYGALKELLGEDCLLEDGTFDKQKMAARIFSDPDLLQKVNGIIHPAVKEYIREQVRKEEAEKKVEFFFLEAALLIEDGYEEMLEELWYVYASEKVREQRLMQDRGYSLEKCHAIMAQQLSDEEFRAHAHEVIVNNGDKEATEEQIRQLLLARKD